MKKVKVMTLSDYNGFTGKEREKYAKKQQKAIKEGILKPEEETKISLKGLFKILFPCVKVAMMHTIEQGQTIQNSENI